MEQSATVKTLHHTELMLKAAYIARADYHSDYDDRNYCWSKHDDSDLLYTSRLTPFKHVQQSFG
ncbi:hypothetical protein SG0102_02560 [Intestinibaculum porci]|uniref:Uncharacterized protein n=1 Tax=Intestinibaculum porci TaxID=2487118 RepID=A0A3G9J413_9FIRM|nr:hypothetical protein [Intestinibaculum porci]BBH25322.1 hypothetical protein SG0102_02560 [Intestinibaculum porci]